ncbi:hypothetical protein [Candidatus Poriferisodalis sp.]|uniref:hypothetical protein n=1 Tax=Candidatus Poriferisodalis sp. TaxID=3101277 RepID=UPI003B01086E
MTRTTPRRFDLLSLAAGLVFVAASLAVAAERLQTGVGIGTTVGSALVVVGIAWSVAAILRARRDRSRDRTLGAAASPSTSDTSSES